MVDGRFRRQASVSHLVRLTAQDGTKGGGSLSPRVMLLVRLQRFSPSPFPGCDAQMRGARRAAAETGSFPGYASTGRVRARKSRSCRVSATFMS